MKTVDILPTSLKARLELDEILRVQADWEEFVDFLNLSEYPVQFHQGEIISMGYASYFHELLVGNLIGLLFQALANSPCRVFGSNQLIYIPGGEAAYNADVSVICEAPQFHTYKNLQATLNPKIVIEVLSDSTRGFDLGPKLLNYKKIESLQEIVFVESQKSFVSVFKRDQVPQQWINLDREGLDTQIEIGQVLLELKDIYAGVF